MASKHPRLILGGSTIGVDNFATLEAVNDLLRVINPLGIKDIDTAAVYPIAHMGDSERLLGEAGAAAQGFAINTKILVLSKDASGTLEPAKIEQSFSTSQKRLQLNGQKLNILHCHAPDYTTPLKTQAAALNALHQKGLFNKVRHSPFTLSIVQTPY